MLTTYSLSYSSSGVAPYRISTQDTEFFNPYRISSYCWQYVERRYRNVLNDPTIWLTLHCSVGFCGFFLSPVLMLDDSYINVRSFRSGIFGIT